MLTGEGSGGGWLDRAIAGLEKKVVLEMFSKSQESWDHIIPSKVISFASLYTYQH